MAAAPRRPPVQKDGSMRSAFQQVTQTPKSSPAPSPKFAPLSPKFSPITPPSTPEANGGGNGSFRGKIRSPDSKENRGKQKPRAANGKDPRKGKKGFRNRTIEATLDDDGIIEYDAKGGGGGAPKKPGGGSRRKRGGNNAMTVGTKFRSQLGTIFTVVRHIGSGGYGEVYHVKDQAMRDYAMKTEPVKPGEEKQEKPEVLVFERIAKEKKKNPEGFPHLINMFENGLKGNTRFIVMTLTGPSLDDVLKKYKPNYHTALRLCVHSLDAIEEFHRVGLIHRDVKPENYLTSFRGKKLIYLADFGMCCAAPDPADKLPKESSYSFLGTVTYASRTSHQGMVQSKKDDVESWIYMCLEFFNKRALPWDEDDQAKAFKLKEAFFKDPTSIVSKAKAPFCFIMACKKVDQCDFFEAPNYKAIRDALMAVCNAEKVDFDKHFDWERNVG